MMMATLQKWIHLKSGLRILSDPMRVYITFSVFKLTFDKLATCKMIKSDELYSVILTLAIVSFNFVDGRSVNSCGGLFNEFSTRDVVKTCLSFVIVLNLSHSHIIIDNTPHQSLFHGHYCITEEHFQLDPVNNAEKASNPIRNFLTSYF